MSVARFVPLQAPGGAPSGSFSPGLSRSGSFLAFYSKSLLKALRTRGNGKWRWLGLMPGL